MPSAEPSGVGPHAYETLLATESGGLGVRILSLPDYLRPYFEAHGPIAGLADEVGIRLLRPVTAAQLPGALDQMASQLFDAVINADEWEQLLEDVMFAPIVVVERSDAVGRALGTVIAGAGAAYLGAVEDSLSLVVAYEATLIVAWFVAGPLIGLREGAKEAAHAVGRAYFEDLFGSLIKRHQERRKGRSR